MHLLNLKIDGHNPFNTHATDGGRMGTHCFKMTQGLPIELLYILLMGWGVVFIHESTQVEFNSHTKSATYN